MANKFLAIDFETANSDLSSICQIGIAEMCNGEVIRQWSSLINPESDFAFWNIKIHGITSDDVATAPTFPEIYEQLKSLLENKIVVSYTFFDKSAFFKAIQKNNLEPLEIIWLDATRIVRNILPTYTDRGYKLQNIASHFSIATKAHDALNDALTCAVIVNKLLEQSNTSINDWITLSKKPIKRINPIKKESLEEQCSKLGWGIQTLIAQKNSTRNWSNTNGLTNVPPEEIAVNELLKKYSIVSWCEGISIHTFLKACALDFLTKNHWLGEFSSREDAVRDSLFMQLNQLQGRIDELCDFVSKPTNEIILNNIHEIFNDDVVGRIYKNLNLDLMIALISATSITLRINLIKTLSQSHEYSNGWPDLTIIHNNTISFIEVKTTDFLKDSQIKFATDIAKPNNLECSVVKITSN